MAKTPAKTTTRKKAEPKGRIVAASAALMSVGANARSFGQRLEDAQNEAVKKLFDDGIHDPKKIVEAKRKAREAVMEEG